MADPIGAQGQREWSGTDQSDEPTVGETEDPSMRGSTKAINAAQTSESPTPSDSGAIGRALQLSAEFVSGVIGGGIVGWLVDQLFGSKPWGLIICPDPGFCAGMLNLMRAAGALKCARSDRKR